MPDTPTLTEERWEQLRPACEEAGAYSEQSLKKWAWICSQAVEGKVHAEWRWLLGDLRERCLEAQITCPYGIGYLIQLVETHNRVQGDFERGVNASVLVEGRNLADLLELIEPGMTVGRIKAIVYKRANRDRRPVEEIEAEQKRRRLSGRERTKRRKHAEKIANWPRDKADSLLPDLKDEVSAYKDAIARLSSEGATFDGGDLALALLAAKELVWLLDLMQTPVAKAA